ncbi:MAG TPA: Vms1/Ankzf1 family peptidyl-tRNA hydrolase [Thermoanaerobaculia bacterium]|nr:Vms1/Ankzf1 family peptidyl-tRNA hydrolase [Thermoanaerobaculia bacterium]
MIDRQLKELASRKESEAPFLSLYLDTHRSDETQKDRLRVLVKDEMRRIREALAGNGHKETVEAGIRQIERYIEESLEPATKGLAIFACPSEDFFVPIQLPVPLEPQLRIGSRPHLRPLVQVSQLHPPIAFAIVDGKSARLFELQFGRILEEIDLEDPDMPRRHDQGGWSQANMQRHVRHHIDRHHKDVSDALTKMVESDEVAGIILSGQERNVANFRGFLPKRIDDLVLGALPMDIRASVDEIVTACQEILSRQRESSIRALVRELEQTARKNGRGALGFDQVVNAVNQQRVERLYLTPAAESRGWRCTRCRTIGRTIPLGCPGCGATVLTVDLVEEIIADCQRESGEVEFAPGDSLLAAYEGIGALLRF